MHSWKKKLVVSQLALACTLAITSQANATTYNTFGYHDDAVTLFNWGDNTKTDHDYLTYGGYVYDHAADGYFDTGFAPIFPDICYHLTHYRPAAADIPVASDNPAHYADAIRYNARTPLQGSLLPLTRLVWA